MQRLVAHRVVWNAMTASYEVQHICPGIFGRLGIVPGTEEWIAWLTRIPSFSFQGKGGHFTARKETRARGDVYWIAYQHKQGTLRKRYIGPQRTVTLAHLEEVAMQIERQSS